jgi:hypothetical protein
MLCEWIRTEHQRLHIVEEWPASTHKDAVITAIHSTLASLLRDLPIPPICAICSAGGRPTLIFSSRQTLSFHTEYVDVAA